MYRNRTIEQYLRRLSGSFPVVLVTGPRQAGKTTLLKYLGDGDEPPRNYVSLDELGPRTLAREDPVLFLQTYRPPLTIDEIQHAPGLLSQLKLLVDRSGEMGGYWLTGSQHFELMKGVSESLAGRVAIVNLLGLSSAEESGRTPGPNPFRPDRISEYETPENEGAIEVFERILRGSFPKFVQPDPPPIDAFYGSYVQTYIERDVRMMTAISDVVTFGRFLRVAASRVGQLLNLSDLARDTGIAVSTAREWMSLLETSFQVRLLQPYFPNIGKRQIKTPKLYFLDTGLVCHLTGWTSADVALKGAMAGALFENYVVTEIIKSHWHRGVRPPVWFWRTKEKKEVDLVIEGDGLIFPVEIKLAGTPDRHALAGMEALRRQTSNVGKGAVICMAPTGSPLTRDVLVVPVQAIH